MRERLEKFISEHGIKHWSFAAKKDKEFMEFVNSKTKDLPESLPFGAKVRAAVYDENPYCENGKLKQFNAIQKGWRYCAKGSECLCANASRSKKSTQVWSEKSREDKLEIVSNRIATTEQKYGVSNPGQLDKTKQAHKVFYSKRDNVERSTSAAKKTMLARYGVDNALKMDIDRRAIAQRNLSEETREILNNKDLFEAYVSDKSVATVVSELGINSTTFYNYMREYDIQIDFGSSFEVEIAKFLDDNNIRYKPRDRTKIKPLELDFYIEDYNLAIEFNGLYFHSSKVVENDFHSRKYKMCENVGIRLFMINEDEYVERKSVIQKKILNLCGKSERGIGARKLNVRGIENSIAIEFCDKHHIQGAPSAIKYSFGAFDNEELVGVICYNLQRTSQEMNLARFCSNGKIYAGMFSKILNFSMKEINQPIITFADLRYSDGGLYEKTGFKKIETLRPDYKYVKRNKTFHKSLFTKKLIAEKFDIDMSAKTEKQAMEELGYSRIYDCGKIKFGLDPRDMT